MAVIDSAYFESNDLSEFDATSVPAGVTFATQTSVVQAGTYALEYTGDETGFSDENTYGRLNFTYPTSTDTVYVQCGLYIAANNPDSNMGGAGATSNHVIEISDSSGIEIARLARGSQNTDRDQLQLRYIQADGTDVAVGAIQTALSGEDFSTAKWLGIRILIDKSGANPVITWWMDTGSGYTQIGTDTDSTSGTSGIANDPARAEFGFLFNGSNWQNTNFTWYFDDIEIHDSDPDAAGGQTITAVSLDVSPTLNAASVDPGTATITAQNLDASPTLNTGSIDASYAILAQNLDASPTLNNASVDASFAIPAVNLDASPTLNTASVDPGAATITATLLDASPTLNLATVATEGAISAVLLSIPPTLNAASVDPGAADIPAIVLDASPTLNLATLSTATIIQAVNLDASPTLNNASVDPGIAAIAAQLLDLAPTLNPATVALAVTILFIKGPTTVEEITTAALAEGVSTFTRAEEATTATDAEEA